MKIVIPEFSLVVLIGTSGAGKSSFAKKYFQSFEVISSDFCRGLVSNDENSQEATNDAFELLRFITNKRLAKKKLTVIDATNVQPESRKPFLALAKENHCLPVAFVFEIDEKICQERNKIRSDRNFGPHVISQQRRQLQKSLKRLKTEGFRKIYTFKSPADLENIVIERQPLWNDLKREHGPFDIIGDIHGCYDELLELLTEKLGYHLEKIAHPENRKVIFLGDLVDRGPKSPAVLKLVMAMVAKGVAFCVPGNHDKKLLRKLWGRDVQIKHGLAETLAQLEEENDAFKKEVIEFIDSLISHYVLDDGKLVVAHAGMKESMQGRASGKVREFALYGETTGEIDEFGFPVRYNWASEYRGKAIVVYGHTPIPKAEWLNRTINIDTGCVFGGELTALRYPEKELVSVKAKKIYYESTKPFLPEEEENTPFSAQQELDEILLLEEVQGKRIIHTQLRNNVTIREENSIAALEVMSRFAANPKWLIYLPPTMSPSETTKEVGLLEHPREAFRYYKNQGISSVICEEKHMGSRTIVIICRDESVVKSRFGISETPSKIGICYTRTGRPFFQDSVVEDEFLKRLKASIDRAELWEELETEWLCLDCELMPWSTKAQALIKDQFAAVGASAKVALSETIEVLEKVKNSVEGKKLLERFSKKSELIQKYIKAYQQYCWPVQSIEDLKLAPFHIMASETGVHANKDHLWHMNLLEKLCGENSLVVKTNYKLIKTTEEKSVHEGISWWESLTQHGGEGMVVKPLSFIAKGKNTVVQPAVKCRGKEYLRIIYGPEYTESDSLARLRERSLATKRSLAIREFALGIEGLERFVQKEPLRRVHECVFGVLALESEPVDPRL